MSLIQWENLQVGYPKEKPLNHAFSGKLSSPGLYSIVGPNGCGKSTLLKTFLGLLPPYSGTVCLDGRPVSMKQEPSCRIAYIPQFHSVNSFFHIRVQDFIEQGYGPHPTQKHSQEELENLLAQWQLAGYSQKSFHELSGGQKTRCMIVRAILSYPKLFFLDEPLANLDNCCQLQLMNTLKKLAYQQQVCLLMVDHHFEKYTDFIQGSFVFGRLHDDLLSTISFT